jgi:hypothetical protein
MCLYIKYFERNQLDILNTCTETFCKDFTILSRKSVPTHVLDFTLHTLPWSLGEHATLLETSAKVPRAKKTIIQQEARDAILQCQCIMPHSQHWLVIGYWVQWTERRTWFSTTAFANTRNCTTCLQLCSHLGNNSILHLKADSLVPVYC